MFNQQTVLIIKNNVEIKSAAALLGRKNNKQIEWLAGQPGRDESSVWL